MPIDPNQPYPMFDHSNPDLVLDIPDNINRNFGNYQFSFQRGSKVNYHTGEYNGDYEIYINGCRWLDRDIWNLAVSHIPNQNIATRLLLIIEELWKTTPQTEKGIYDKIANFQFSFLNTSNLINQAGIPIDAIQTFLYFSWHRCHIEERAYPSFYRYNGRGDYLGATYILLANRYNLRPLNQNLQNSNFIFPQNVYNMANNRNNIKQSLLLKRTGFQNYLSSINQNQHLPL